jgi:Cytochrome P460
MMKPVARPVVVLVAVLALALTGCSDDGDETTTPVVTSEFEDYTTWTQVEYTNAPSAFLGAAHQGADPEFTRAIYTSAPAKSEGDYPVGTVFVKETFTHDAEGNPAYPAAMGLLGMIKRSPGFDTAGGDWEYFNIDTADLGTIASGADLGSCKGCHVNAVGANGQDHIFTHPYEHQAVGADFADYAAWHLIGTSQGPDALLGAAHEGNDADAVRKIYKKQLQARPVAGDWNGYPVGTLLLKTVQDAGGNLIGMTAMAKRGGLHDPTHGGWEYFMMNMDTEELMPMGENASMCIGCHTGANSGGNGQDYVFAHADDPFNN